MRGASFSVPSCLPCFLFQTLFASLALCNKHQIHFCSHLSHSQSFKDLIVSTIIHLLLFLKLHIFPFLTNSQKVNAFIIWIYVFYSSLPWMKWNFPKPFWVFTNSQKDNIFVNFLFVYHQFIIWVMFSLFWDWCFWWKRNMGKCYCMKPWILSSFCVVLDFKFMCCGFWRWR